MTPPAASVAADRPAPGASAPGAPPVPGASPDARPGALADALVAARLCAIDPGLGGMILRGGGPSRDAVIATLRAALPDDAPFRRLPVHADEEALFGGLDVGATLGAGGQVRRRGLFAEAAGGLVVAAMAERLTDARAARIAGALEARRPAGKADALAPDPSVPRATAGPSRPAGVILVALDDGIEADENPPAALAERLAFRIDLTALVPPPGSSRDPLVAPDLFRGPPIRAPRTCEVADEWMPQQARHDGESDDPATNPDMEKRTAIPAMSVRTIAEAATASTPARAGARSGNADEEGDAGPRDLPDRASAGEGPGREAGARHTSPAPAPRDSLTPDPLAGDDHLRALAATTLALGIDSARAPLFALRAARASARLAGRAAIADEDVALAARLVLGPRATRMPPPPEAEAEAPPPPPPPPEADGADEEDRGEPGAIDDVVLAAALASLPPDLLARIAAGAGAAGGPAARAAPANGASPPPTAARSAPAAARPAAARGWR